jgi:hypothetical protein
MANTEVKITNDGGLFLPGVSSIPVVTGDSISFSTNDGSPVALFFSPDAASILKPRPTMPTLIAASGKAEFTFTSSGPGAYSVFCGSADSPIPTEFPGKVSTLLTLQMIAAITPTFSGSADTMTPGH